MIEFVGVGEDAAQCVTVVASTTSLTGWQRQASPHAVPFLVVCQQCAALMSRISALFRRDSKKSSPTSTITIGDLTIDRTSYTININSGEPNGFL